ncbi:MAG: aminotransferase class I/II-fold pyridoxal phosphate-dependent enzyme [Acidobacteriota bacterium]
MQPPPFELERYFARYEFALPHLLSSSDCETLSVAELLALEPDAEDELLGLRLGYTETLGDPRLRASVARMYESIEPDQLLVHSGAEEVIFSFMNVALEPGDHLVVHHPGYQSTHSVAAAAGVDVTFWRAREDDGWSLDPDELAAAIGPKTRAVVLNCPNNPTGWLMDRERFDATIALAREHGLFMFSDEVYRELEHDPADRLPAACDVYEKAVSLGVTSKTYGLPGLRIGWAATRDAELLSKMAAFKDYVTICASAPSELLARVAMDHREELAERNRRLVVENLDLADGFFERQAEHFAWRRPNAGPIAFPRLRRGGTAALCDRLAQEAGVLLLPSTVYGVGDDHVRMGFGRKSFPQDIEVLERALTSMGGD